MSFNIATLVTDQLNCELPVNLKDKIKEFETLVKAGKYRPAYLILDELKRTPGWSPSQTLLGYYQRFWWELAN